jgi:hypothetical protein
MYKPLINNGKKKRKMFIMTEEKFYKIEIINNFSKTAIFFTSYKDLISWPMTPNSPKSFGDFQAQLHQRRAFCI